MEYKGFPAFNAVLMTGQRSFNLIPLKSKPVKSVPEKNEREIIIIIIFQSRRNFLQVIWSFDIMNNQAKFGATTLNAPLTKQNLKKELLRRLKSYKEG